MFGSQEYNTMHMYLVERVGEDNVIAKTNSKILENARSCKNVYVHTNSQVKWNKHFPAKSGGMMKYDHSHCLSSIAGKECQIVNQEPMKKQKKENGEYWDWILLLHGEDGRFRDARIIRYIQISVLQTWWCWATTSTTYRKTSFQLAEENRDIYKYTYIPP